MMHAALSFALLALALPAVAAPPPARDLIVLVLVDAMRPDHMGAYGYAPPTTPTLDALAKTSRRYTRAYTNAPWTRPSTTTFLTGQNASRHRTETSTSKLPDDVTTLAERLHKAGYVTAGFTANGNGGSLAGLQRGFDHFEDPTRTYTKDKRGQVFANNLPTGAFLVEHALAYLRTSKAQKLFVFLFLVDPHDPYETTPALEKQFLGPDWKGVVRRKAMPEINNDYPADERFSMQAIYDASIRAADNALATFFAGLAGLGLFEGASLFVASDHGEAFGEHNFYLHAHHFWEEVIHIPLLAHGPRFAPGIDERLTQPLDVSATLAQLAGADAAGLPGRSLLAPPVPGATVISEYNEFGIHRQAIMDGTWKVIWQRPADGAVFDQNYANRAMMPSVVFDRETVQVYDLIRDPKEQHDLSASMPPRAAELLAALRAFVSG